MSAPEPAAEPDIRVEVLSPVSPKPVHFPSPANIPILERQMDPAFHESLPPALAPVHIELPTPIEPQTEPEIHQEPSVAEARADNGAVDTAVSQNGVGAEVDAGEKDQTVNQEPSIQEKTDALHPSTDALSDAQATVVAQEPSIANIPDSNPPSQDTPAVKQPNTQAASAAPVSSETPSLIGGDVDLGALLAKLTKSPPSASGGTSSNLNTALPAVPAQAAPGSSPSATGLKGSGSPNLPPKPPPPQEQPSTHPNRPLSNDFRTYQPLLSHATLYGTPGAMPNVMTGASAMPSQPNPPFPQQPMSATYASNSPATPTYPRHSLEPPGTDGDRWDIEGQRQYDQFLQDERANEQDRNWSKFPDGSRLFVGNLPTEIVTKRDLFQKFHKYGKIVQISIKKAFGFVQFLDSDVCRRALANEQGTTIRGRRTNLEISRPQQSRDSHGSQTGRGGDRRRSRSPGPYRQQHGRGTQDRYSNRPASPRDRDRHYRPGRSPSPRGYRRDRRGRSPDRYDSRRRSRSPVGRYSRSPPRPYAEGDGLPFPPRHPTQVPDVQLLMLESLEASFIEYVVNAFRSKGLRTDTLFLPPNIPEDLIIKRQAREGVIAVVRLNNHTLLTGSIPLLLFDRSQGYDNVNFSNYDSLKVEVAADLVLTKKQNAIPNPRPISYPQQRQWGPPPPSYGYQPPPAPIPFNAPPQRQQPPPSAPHYGINNLLGTMNSNLLSQAQPQPASVYPPYQQSPVSAQPDLSNLLRSIQSQPPTQPPYAASYPAYGQQAPTTAVTAPPPVQAPLPQQSAQGSQPDMNQLMAQLAQYSR